MSHSNKVTVVLGAQWGDEGKGKLVDLLTENMQLVARLVLQQSQCGLRQFIVEVPCTGEN